VTSSWGGRRKPPYVFTEHGVAMLSSVLKSDRAVQMSILIIRAFVKMRELLASHKSLAARVEKLEASQKRHASVINILAEAIEALTGCPPYPKSAMTRARTKEVDSLRLQIARSRIGQGSQLEVAICDLKSGCKGKNPPLLNGFACGSSAAPPRNHLAAV
jgi:hypothetical protein